MIGLYQPSMVIEHQYVITEDIPILVEYFINNICNSYNIKPYTIKNNNYLVNYNWPGNVRELRNLIERITILTQGKDEEKILNIINNNQIKSFD